MRWQILYQTLTSATKYAGEKYSLKGLNFPPAINIDIEGYSIEQTPTEASCGGALLYIANKFQYKTRPDLLIYKTKSLESIFIEILCQNQQNIVVGCIYKHPCMEIDEFISDFLTPLLEKLSSENKSVFLMGDFNINLLQCNDNDHISEYFNMLTSNNILPHINYNTNKNNKQIKYSHRQYLHKYNIF